MTHDTRTREVDAVAEAFVDDYCALDPVRADAFDLRSFHRAALDLGSIGLDPLREALGRLT